MTMHIRMADEADLGVVLKLYTELHDEAAPPPSDGLTRLWAGIMADPNRYVVLVEIDRTVAGSCELIIVPNLTHNQRPYGLIENVVTGPAFRRQGCALAALNHAKAIAMDQNCYKLMLMTGGRDGNHALYEKAGFNRHDKTAFVQWL
ncbi:GNAT family N-acetyltransferase [Ruminococcaceae bacterium OttesenSCG-928-A11]|nr:GNAT family N-acetyltransferase [Ruminococcaceae bacterium OttesenSCG-928-A11]